ncbi:fimbria/pilus outer membrane usher protein [Franconibacter pulveris 601]|uniref:fimbria/pilus outer membrane usher protein n=1 Tax=Franconibacter pulveris TaxID=435910 RepID=UPI00046300A7|nr:fimbria/pilus outer membrane usher protein [Franconibacter pulveris]
MKRQQAFGLLLTSILLESSLGYAADVFNPAALEIDNPTNEEVDLSQFADKGKQLPGIYHVDLYINQTKFSTQDVEFKLNAAGELSPLFTIGQLKSFGVTNLPAEEDDTVIDIAKSISDAVANFDFDKQELTLSIPQSNLKNIAQGSVDSSLWDDGLTAAIINYSLSGSKTDYKPEGDNKNIFLNLRSGINLGAWRFRNYSTWNKHSGDDSCEYCFDDSDSYQKWESISTYAQRDLRSIGSKLAVGELYTPSDVFDSVQFKGVKVYSDDEMLPDSLKGFAPTIRGIANSNAQVSIRQNGSLIYQTYVSPGAFVINDLYPTSAGGDLEVIIKEADGSERKFIQPFASVPMMQREGRIKYAVAVGKYRANEDTEFAPRFLHTTAFYGLPHDLTVYGGSELAEEYQAVALGLGLNLFNIGSFSIDVTGAKAANQGDDKETKKGHSIRFQYSKNIEATNSTVTLAGYRYSTKGFYTLEESTEKQDSDYREKTLFQLSFLQSLGGYGSMFLSGYQKNYWGNGGTEKNIGVGYNGVYQSITYGLAFSQTKYSGFTGGDDKQVSANVSVPFTVFDNSVSATFTATHSKTSGDSYVTGLSGVTSDNTLNYNIAESYAAKDGTNSASMGLSYKATYGEITSGYSKNSDSSQINFGARGSVIAHPYGLTFGQANSGDSAPMVLVKAPGANGAAFDNYPGVHTDWRGYTLIPYASAYRMNRVAIKPETLSNSVELAENVKNVIPTSGAVVLADFNTNVGKRVLFTLKYKNSYVPFGAITNVIDKAPTTGITSENGAVYLSGVPDKGQLDARWGKGVNQHCSANFILPNDDQSSVIEITTTCR